MLATPALADKACGPAQFEAVRSGDGAVVGHTVRFDPEPVLSLIAAGCGYLRLGCNTCHATVPKDCTDGDDCDVEISCTAKRCYSMGPAEPSCDSRMARFGCLDPAFMAPTSENPE